MRRIGYLYGVTENGGFILHGKRERERERERQRGR